MFIRLAFKVQAFQLLHKLLIERTLESQYATAFSNACLLNSPGNIPPPAHLERLLPFDWLQWISTRFLLRLRLATCVAYGTLILSIFCDS